MEDTGGKVVRLGDLAALKDWFDRARRPWSPIMVAGRQFDELIGDGDDVPSLAAYDHLYEVADLAMGWLEDNPCPDNAIGGRLKAQMMGYRAVADTVRSTVTESGGDAMVARLRYLREIIDAHVEAMDGVAQFRMHLVRTETAGRGPCVPPPRPRQSAAWAGMLPIEGDSPFGFRECRVVDISMLGLGITLNHPSPSELLGRRIFVDVPAASDSLSIRFEGDIGNVGPTQNGAVRVDSSSMAPRNRSRSNHRLARKRHRAGRRWGSQAYDGGPNPDGRSHGRAAAFAAPA